jgi:hypothetical protein
MTVTLIHPIDEPPERRGEESSDEEDEPPSTPGLLDAHPACGASTRPSGVWFGPKGSDADERNLIAFLGSHNGTAVLQWPRDADRASKLRGLGIPCLWFVQDITDVPAIRCGSEEWLSRTSDDLQIHASLERLCRWVATERAADPLVLEEGGWLHLGEHGIQLTTSDSSLAATLIARLGEAVDDDLLLATSACTASGQRHWSLTGQLHHLDQEVNALGFEVVPAIERTHVMRRCWS